MSHDYHVTLSESRLPAEHATAVSLEQNVVLMMKIVTTPPPFVYAFVYVFVYPFVVLCYSCKMYRPTIQ